MAMFTENSTTYMDEFSREFEEGIMEIIRRKARSHRMSANVIYREYISNKSHFHMNATVWETLTDFVMYLGREGKCEVDETEKGWFVTYIDRDPETLRKIEERAKRERDELTSEEKHERAIEAQARVAFIQPQPPTAPMPSNDCTAPAGSLSFQLSVFISLLPLMCRSRQRNASMRIPHRSRRS